MAEENSNISTPTNWRKGRGTELTLPSENVALLRRPDLREFLAGGKIPDSLAPIVKSAMSGKTTEQIRKEEEQRAQEDPDAMAGYLEFVDYVVLRATLQPPLRGVPTDDEGQEIPLDERDQEYLYVDEVDFEDKVAIFEWAVGGHVDLEPFREEEVESVADVSDVPAVPQPPEPPAGGQG